MSTSAVSAKVGGLLFNGLMRRENDLTLVTDLAKSWQMETQVRYRFVLRDNLFFHDGRKLTSTDIRASYEFMLDKKNRSPYRSALTVIDSIETPDTQTVVFNLKRADAPFLGNMTIGILPAGTTTQEANESPVGTGPFKFISYKLEEDLLLSANKNYFRSRPKFDQLLLKVIPDETVRILELESGGIDIITNPISPVLLPRLTSEKNLKVIKKTGTNYSYLGFNMKDKYAGDLAVRRAIAYAIDRDSIIEHIMKGLAQKATGLLSPVNYFHTDNLPAFEYNPEKAKEILDRAGLKDPDGDGPQMRFTMNYSTSQNELRKTIAQVFKWQLAKVGIGIEIVSTEWGTFYGNIKKGNFQIFSMTWVGIADPDIMYYIFHSSSMPPAGANRGRYENKKLDKLLDEGRVADTKQRKVIYSEAQKIVADDLVYISLWHPVNVAVTSARVHNFRLAPDENLTSLADVRLH